MKFRIYYSVRLISEFVWQVGEFVIWWYSLGLKPILNWGLIVIQKATQRILKTTIIIRQLAPVSGDYLFVRKSVVIILNIGSFVIAIIVGLGAVVIVISAWLSWLIIIPLSVFMLIR